MKILVTGANGYIGSKVVKKLLDLGYEVVALSNNTENIDKRANIIKANVLDGRNYYEIAGNPDVCLHLAWKDGFVHNSVEHMKNLSNHFEFVKNMVDSGIKQVAVMGTMHEAGYFEGEMGELNYTNPQSLYGIAKDALRRSLEVYCKDKNVSFQWLRAFYIYGNDELGNSIFSKLIQANKYGKRKFPFTTGKNKYDFLSIDEVVEQIILTITQNNITGEINICSGIPISLAEQIEKYIYDNDLNIELEYGKFPDRPYDSPCVYGDSTKIRQIMENKIEKNERKM